MKPLKVLEDTALVQLINNGNFEAFNILYDRYINMVYRRVAMLIPVADVEDVTQEVFISVLKSIKQYRQEAKFSTWLRTITNRRIADFYRQRETAAQKNIDDLDIDDNVKNNRNTNMDFDTTILLQQVVKQLSNDQQEILLLRFVDGLQFNEIADHLSISLDAAKSRFRRAVELVRLDMVNQ
jgi:RNA polymerase sigma-70 factor, ECF subfamily